MFAWRAFPALAGAHAGAYCTVPALKSAGIRVAFTARGGGFSGDSLGGGFSDGGLGSLNLSFVAGDDPALVAANRARALRTVGAAPAEWTSGQQVHGARATYAGPAERGRGAASPETTIPDTDALWTDQPGTALVVLTADCVPIALADPQRRRVGVIHAGWRGLVAGVVEHAVEAIGVGPGLRAFIGPSIGPCCYEVGEEVAAQALAALGRDAVRSPATEADPIRMDLWRSAATALRRAGVAGVDATALCTRCEPHRFFSHRAGSAARQGVLVAMDPSRVPSWPA